MRPEYPTRLEHNTSREKEQEMREKYQATLVGGAIGDTLGMPVEGWKPQQIQRYVGRIIAPIDPMYIQDAAGNIHNQDDDGPLPYIAVSAGLKKGAYTDDTLLSLATARAIVKANGLNLSALAQESIALYKSSTHLPRKDGQFGLFGRTTADAFDNLIRGALPTTSGVMGKSPGNAPSLKMAPVGLWMHATGQYEEGLAFSEIASQMTHLDARSIVSGILQAHAVYTLLKGTTPDEFLLSLRDVCKKWEKSKEQGKSTTMLERIQWIIDNKNADEHIAYDVLGPGWAVTKNYPFVIYMLYKYWDHPFEGLMQLVNYGGDCDSTGALYGALAGAKNGNFFPEEWLKDLQDRQIITELADKIYLCKQI